MYCKRCGKKLSGTERFCSECGLPIDYADEVKSPSGDSIESAAKSDTNFDFMRSSFHLEGMNWDLEGYPVDEKKTDIVDFDWASVLEGKERKAAEERRRANAMSEEDIYERIKSDRHNDEFDWDLVHTMRIDRPGRTDQGLFRDEDEDLLSVDFIPPLNTAGSYANMAKSSGQGEPTSTRGTVVLDRVGKAETESISKETAEAGRNSTYDTAQFTPVSETRKENKKKIEKFYTFNRKNEEFQALLDEEYERIRQKVQKETEKEDIGKALAEAPEEPSATETVTEVAEEPIKTRGEIAKESAEAEADEAERLAEEAERLAEEAAARAKAAEEAAAKAAAEAAAAEEAFIALEREEEAARIAAEEEAARIAAEEEAARKAAEEEAARKAAEEEAARKAAEEEAARKAAEEEAARKAAKEEAARKAAEEEAARIAAEEEAARKAAEEEAARKAAEEEARKAEEAVKFAEEEAARKLEEAKSAEEVARQAEEEVARLAAEEEAARKAAEEEAARLAAEEEAARKAAEEEAARLVEEEAARKAEEETARKAAEEEAARKLEEAKAAESSAMDQELQRLNESQRELEAAVAEMEAEMTQVIEGNYAEEETLPDGRRVSYSDIFEDDGEEDYEAERKRGGCRALILDILIVVLALALAISALLVFLPDHAITKRIRDLLPFTRQEVVPNDEAEEPDSENNGEEQEPQEPEEPVVSEITAAINKNMDVSANIESVAEDPALTFTADHDYGMEGVDIASSFSNANWYVADSGEAVTYVDRIVGTVMEYYSKLADKLNNDETAVMELIAEDSPLYGELNAITANAEVVHKFNSIQIGEIRNNGSDFYVLVRVAETITGTEEADVTTKVIYLQADDEEKTLKIINVMDVQ